MTRLRTIGVAVSVTIALLTACGSDAFTMRGKMSLTMNGRSVIGGPELCSGFFGYGDITEGAAVTVYDATGKIIASGRLGRGNAPDRRVCTFPFEIANVPGGEDFYQVEVANRGRATVTADDARAGRIDLGIDSARG